jgi:thymidylate kinase
MLLYIKKLFFLLDKNKIIYCHWKSNEHLEDALAGKTDLDVLVDKNQKKECSKILKDFNFKQVFSPSFSSYPFIEDWIGFDNKSGKLIHLHLHYRLLTGKKLVKEQFLPWEKKVLSTVIFDKKNEVYIIDPHIELVILIIRIGIKTNLIQLLKGKYLPKNISNEIEYLKQRTQKDKVYELCIEFFNKKEAKKIIKLIYKNKLSFINILQLKLFIYRNLSKYRRFNLLKANTIYFFNAFRIRLIKLLNKLGASFQVKKTIKPKGVVIAVIGADGSGKSTIVGELEKWLSWKIDTKKMYLGQKKSFFFRLLRIASINLRNVLSARNKYKKVLLAYKIRKRGGVVVTDRYPQNQFRGINDGPLVDISQKSGFLEKICFQYEDKIFNLIKNNYYPDVVIKLSVSPDVALKRKDNKNPEIVKEKVSVVENLIFEKSRVLKIDASKDIESVLLEIKEKIWGNI